MKKIIMLITFIVMFIGISNVAGASDDVCKDANCESLCSDKICWNVPLNHDNTQEMSEYQIPRSYSFSPNKGTKTTINVPSSPVKINTCSQSDVNDKNWGCKTKGDYYIKWSDIKSTCNNSRFCTGNNLKKNLNIYALYQNVGYYNGQAVDMKVSINGFQFPSTSSNSAITFRFGNSPSIAVSSTDSANSFVYFRVQYLKHGTDKLIVENNKKFYSVISFNDIDYREKLKIKNNNVSKFILAKMYENNGANEIRHIDATLSNGWYMFEGNHNLTLHCAGANWKQTQDNPLYYADVTCDADGDKNGNVKIGGPKQSSNGNYSSNGKKYSEFGGGIIRYPSDYPRNFKFYWKSNFDNNPNLLPNYSKSGNVTALFNKSEFEFAFNAYYSGLIGITYSPILPNAPTKRIKNKTQNSIETTSLDNVKKNDEIIYTIYQYVPNEPSNWRFTTWKITDKVPSELDYNTTNVKIYNGSTDVTEKFNISKSGQELTVSPRNISNLTYNSTYKIQINAKVNDTVSNNKTVKNTAYFNYTLTKTGSSTKLSRTEPSNPVKFTVKAPETCDERLTQLKNSYKNGTIQQGQALSELFDIYEKFNTKNKLLNYDFVDGKLNLDNTSCSTSSCDSIGGDLVCTGNSENPIDEPNNRPCFLSKDDYDIPDKGAYCTVSYKLVDFKFIRDTVFTGQILWHGWPGSEKQMGKIEMDIKCEAYSDQRLSNSSISYSELSLNEFVPTLEMRYAGMGIPLTTSMSEHYQYKDDGTTIGADPTKMITSHVYCNQGMDSACTDNGPRYYLWHDKFVFKLFNQNNWYSKFYSGTFISKNAYDKLLDSVQSQYFNMGTGVPIDLKESKGIHNVTLKMYAHDFENNIACPFVVDNEIIREDCIGSDCDDDDDYEYTNEFNFDFRVIDTDNPFPGAGATEGSSRLTGSNWCADANIGKIKQDNAGKYYMVGDFTGSGTIGSDDLVAKNKFLAPIGDVDGDGVASYDTNCTSSSSDYCVLKRYVSRGDRSLNCSSSPVMNNMVKNYITDAKNSYSTDEPMYSFTLTSQDVKNIRNYNKKHSYTDDWNVTCDEQGEKCKSEFLTDWIEKKKVNGKSLSKSAQASVNNASCYETRVAGNWCGNS